MTLAALGVILAGITHGQFAREWQSPNLGSSAWGASYGYDISGDGKANLWTRAGGTLTIYNPDYSVWWQVSFPGYDYVYLVAPRDVDGDGLVRPVNMDADPAGEVVITAYRLDGSDYYGVVRVYDAVTRTLEWQSAELAGFYGTASVDDVDGDSKHEVIITRINYAGGWGYVEVFGHSGAGAGEERRYELKSRPSAAPSVTGAATTVAFQVGVSGRVRLQVLDSTGREVKELIDADMPAGDYGVKWDGTDEMGRPAPAGTYLYRLERGGDSETGRLVLVR